MSKYHVEVEYWNGGHRELITGEPVDYQTANKLREALRLESRSGEFFIYIVKVDKTND